MDQPPKRLRHFCATFEGVGDTHRALHVHRKPELSAPIPPPSLCRMVGRTQLFSWAAWLGLHLGTRAIPEMEETGDDQEVELDA